MCDLNSILTGLFERESKFFSGSFGLEARASNSKGSFQRFPQGLELGYKNNALVCNKL